MELEQFKVYSQLQSRNADDSIIGNVFGNMLNRRVIASFSFLLGFLLFPDSLFAHVKWFTEGTYADKPHRIADITTDFFYAIGALTLLVTAIGVIIDDRIQNLSWYLKIDNWFENQRDKSVLVMRFALAMTFLLSWQDDAMLVPNVRIKAEWIGWYQFLLTFLLLFPRTVPLAGLGTVLLYGLGQKLFSGFHMLDYMLYLGVGWYLMVSGVKEGKLRKSGLMLLYLTVGFSLCWVALEKFVYPEWAYQIIRDRNLNLGLDPKFFLTGAAFVEFGLGYLMIICMLQRPLAVIITLVFFTTTMVFGKIEIIGHTLLHGCLIVFLFEGRSVIYNMITGYIKSVPARIAFASVFFVILFFGLLYPYSYLAEVKYKNRFGKEAFGRHHEHIPLEYPSDLPIPSVKLSVEKDAMSGFNLHIGAENFVFSPEHAGDMNTFGEGHAHLYLNGTKIARLYSNWYHIPDLPVGKHDLEVTLHTNMHQLLTLEGESISDKEIIEVEFEK
ncbi:MAG: hypothetical protein ACI959_000257 [Limisphaerales bacterium]|jgi:hypothetical protein